jgi:transposase-like protein
MIDFPITDLMDEAACVAWLETNLHPDGFVCPDCGSSNRRLFRRQGSFSAYRCRACDGYYTLLTGTAFAKTRQTACALVLLIRGIAKGEATARLARELALSRQQLGTLRKRVMHNLNDTAPTELMEGTAFEADEVYQNAGGKKLPAS